MSQPKPTTSIATSTPTDIYVRGKSLCDDLLGKLSFTEMMCFQLVGRVPSPAEIKVIDACLVALLEHGLTPSVIATRLVYASAPEALQGAVAAGLLGVGSRFVGTAEGCAVLLARIVAATNAGADGGAEATRIVAEHRSTRRALPGFGHDTHTPDDPRTPRLFAIARENGVAGPHIAAIATLSAALDRAIGKHITINATGACAAALSDLGFPSGLLRGMALIARCAGLVGHAYEESQRPAMMTMWEAAANAVPYDAGPSHLTKPKE